MKESDMIRARDIGVFFNLKRLEKYLEDNGHSVPERPDIVNLMQGSSSNDEFEARMDKKLEVILATQKQIDKCLTVLGVEGGLFEV